MKISAMIAVIIISTCCLCGLFYKIIYQDLGDDVVTEKKQVGSPDKPPELQEKIAQSAPTSGSTAKAPEEQSDEMIIRELVSLSDEALRQEFAALSQHIKDKGYFSDLEARKLGGREAMEAKKAIERFSLLSIEGTRRKYASIEPELHDPFYAHKNSLKDIRKTLDRY